MGNRTRRPFRRTMAMVVAPLLVVGAAVAAAGTAGAEPEHADPLGILGPAVPSGAAELAGLAPLPTASLPEAGSLVDEILSVSGRLGVGQDRATVQRDVDDANLSPESSGALAGLVAQLGLCNGDTTALLGRTSHADLMDGTAQPDPASAAALRACAVTLRGAMEAARPALTDTGDAKPLRIWPLLAFSPGETDDTYVEDYMLTVDQGGNDTYLNNQGGNQIDVKRSVTNPLARYHEPARGCRQTYPDSLSGRVLKGPDGSRVPSFDGPECVPAAALLWDMDGDDTYGVREAPEFPDDLCSSDPAVRRFATIGSGVEGVGMLVDEAGNDRYTGRTGTMGSGHLGGVGLLEDRDGDDHYLAMRNAQGLGLLVGVGILHDDAGDDDYDYYMPGPLDPDAEFQTDGSGGVIDDSGLGSELHASPNDEDKVGGRCDNLPRSLQGVGIFVAPALGLLVDSAGDDTYRAAGYRNQEEGLPTQAVPGLIRFAHGSQGSGFLGGIGAMLDLAGTGDRYLREEGQPADDRHNGQVLGPKPDLSLEKEGSLTNGEPLDLSLFVDTE
ncbi:hypothetical protein [Pseudonocardia endophytica]|uniref:Uncharacterized protein n=1 Tax=Pseudonocardia endophytica TaxID=401976 RepID=A0A4R1I9B0_PSEEN|nr:hypothetical protein [Pseudonocardia endophytica]TCK26812.1 hypothetical protein EV378_2657 [Pseudonocardia endophytica]